MWCSRWRAAGHPAIAFRQPVKVLSKILLVFIALLNTEGLQRLPLREWVDDPINKI